MAARKKARSKAARPRAPVAAKQRQTKSAAKPSDRQPAREESAPPDQERPEAPTTKGESVETGAHADGRSPKHDASDRIPIVAIGASAGGLTALGLLLDAMPHETGMAFVLIQHLDPTKASLTAELLANHTRMKIAEVQGTTRVQPNHVYVMPPAKYISISDGMLRLIEPPTPRASRLPIDFFFRALAEENQERAIAIILSGTGADGTLGIKAIKAHGGISIVQDPQTAEHQGMPRNAIATDMVDYVLPIERMPKVLAGYPQHPYVNAALELAKEPSGNLDAIVALIRARTRYDFRSYKKGTLSRRVSRRMCLRRIEDVEEYVAALQEDLGEVEALVKDLLISVTGFFREPAAWKELEELAIGPLVARKSPDETIRVWVPGCATGEEAYSVAMVLIDQLQGAQKDCRLQIFATDIDRQALDHARSGSYADSIVAAVPSEYLTRFFKEDRGCRHYEVAKSLREAVVFAEQNLISDPSFSRLDLICCRNVLIYLEPEVQAKLIALFNYALVDEGCLFLGNAETAGGDDDLFRALSPNWRIYRRTPGLRRALVVLPRTPQGPPNELEPVSEPGLHGVARLVKLAEHRLLEEFGPAAVLIDRRFHILYFYGRTDEYLTQLCGLPTLNLLERAREGLRNKLRAVVPRALHECHTVSVAAQVKRGRRFHPCRIRVVPIGQSNDGENWLLVVFDGRREVNDSKHSVVSVERSLPAAGPDAGDDESAIRDLERELSTTRQELRTTIEELAVSNVQFKASNEGMMSTNEELQSLNEELETSKEELQSLNEELSTVNTQLAAKLGELQAKNDDLNNLMTSTAVATLCLDADYRVRWFTPALTDLVRLVDSDVGRPFGDFAHNFTEQQLLQVAQGVSRTMRQHESEVQTLDGRWFIQLVRPYRTADNRIDGVVITFTDITHRKRLERQQQDITDSLEDQVSERVESLRVLQNVTRAANEASTVQQAMHATLKQICEHGGWTLGHLLQRSEDAGHMMVSSGVWFVSGDDRFEDSRRMSAHIRFPSGEEMIGRVLETRQPIWVDDLRRVHDWKQGDPAVLSVRSALAFPVTTGEQVVAVLEFLADHATQRDDRLLEVIPDVGIQLGHLIERKQLEKQIADGVDREQRRIGEELHDSLGQELTAIAYLASNLRELLAADGSTEVTRVDRLIEAVNEAREKVVSLAQGLLPEIDAEGLAAALEQLTREAENTYQIECSFECEAPVSLTNSFRATQLYRIGQEAIHNAVKHASAAGIVVRLTRDPTLQLQVRDNGVGFAEPPRVGSGLRIMRHRADLIGARLSVESTPGSGTVVTATLPQLLG